MAQIKDSRSPEQLGIELADAALRKLGRPMAIPQVMLVSDSFENFCKGRGFDKAQRLACEISYKKRWEIIQ